MPVRTYPASEGRAAWFARRLLVLALISTTLLFGVFARPVPASAAQQVQLSGWLSVANGDPGPDAPAQAFQVRVYLADPQTAETTELQMALSDAWPLNRKLVDISGTAASAAVLPQSQRPASLRVSSARLSSRPGISQSPGPDVVSGSQPWVNIACRFSDSIGTTPEPVSYFAGMMASTFPGLDHFWREVSYGMANIVGSQTVSQWYNLPQPWSYYVVNNTADLGKLVNDCTAAADAEVFYPSFVGINMMFNQNLDCCAWGGGYYLNRDGQSKGYRVTWMPPWGYRDQSVLAHEMGHGFGLPHSSGPYGQTYDSNWDVMSWGGRCCQRDATYGYVASGTISYHHDILGWIPAGRKYVAPLNTRNVITLEQLDLPQSSSNYLMAQIPIPGGSTFYTVEARKQVSYDLAIPAPAVIIHQINTAWSSPAHVVDTNSDGNSNVNDASAEFTVGKTFTDAANKISVSTIASGPTSFTVVISNGVVARAADTVGIYRPSNHTFYLRNSNSYGFADLTVQFGSDPSDFPIVGDWNGDGIDTVGVYRRSQGIFYLSNSNVSGSIDITPFYMGIANDQPIAGHWTTNMGADGVGVYRNSNGILYLKKQLNTGFADFAAVLGIPGDYGVAGDWEGNGYDSPGVYRPSQGQFYLSYNSQPNGVTFADVAFIYGSGGDVPFAGDWIGQGHAGVGMFRPSNGWVYLRNSLTTGYGDNSFFYGVANDIPVAGKWIAGPVPPPQSAAAQSILVPGKPGVQPTAQPPEAID